MRWMGDAVVIEVTRINGTKIVINAELIEFVEDTPDTVITLSTGKKMVVKEKSYKIIDLVIRYKQEIFTQLPKVSQEGGA